jgi:hypothetical protein
MNGESLLHGCSFGWLFAGRFGSTRTFGFTALPRGSCGATFAAGFFFVGSTFPSSRGPRDVAGAAGLAGGTTTLAVRGAALAGGTAGADGLAGAATFAADAAGSGRAVGAARSVVFAGGAAGFATCPGSAAGAPVFPAGLANAAGSGARSPAAGLSSLGEGLVARGATSADSGFRGADVSGVNIS